MSLLRNAMIACAVYNCNYNCRLLPLVTFQTARHHSTIIIYTSPPVLIILCSGGNNGNTMIVILMCECPVVNSTIVI